MPQLVGHTTMKLCRRGNELPTKCTKHNLKCLRICIHHIYLVCSFQVSWRYRQPQHQEHVGERGTLAVGLQSGHQGPDQGERHVRRTRQGGVLQNDGKWEGQVRGVRQFQSGSRKKASHTLRDRRQQQMVAESTIGQRTGIRICDRHAWSEAGEWVEKKYFAVRWTRTIQSTVTREICRYLLNDNRITNGDAFALKALKAVVSFLWHLHMQTKSSVMSL